MKKKIKVIDLLNKIANGEEVPKKIKDSSFELTLNRDGKHYGGQTTTVLNSVFGMNRLNDEIEIIEEPMKIEKFDFSKVNTIIDEDLQDIKNKLNEIIDYINKGDINE